MSLRNRNSGPRYSIILRSARQIIPFPRRARPSETGTSAGKQHHTRPSYLAAIGNWNTSASDEGDATFLAQAKGDRCTPHSASCAVRIDLARIQPPSIQASRSRWTLDRGQALRTLFRRAASSRVGRADGRAKGTGVATWPHECLPINPPYRIASSHRDVERNQDRRAHSCAHECYYYLADTPS
ncbi:hypothetical protein K505DRAFT_118356 [Melanomma pulvis-pyrius CBS 109.77]|uniref:Uncharacterized protein n=1 Tax=Melanomma pulvis-pyrius CBS 109.77 TaxID=1314802 RepID=A0A6A6WVP9_9PLEO|nr:hypothetical protein K505DRAFT_118356 [Melanomma pulvis-pyrius CBS 109.77]